MLCKYKEFYDYSEAGKPEEVEAVEPEETEVKPLSIFYSFSEVALNTARLTPGRDGRQTVSAPPYINGICSLC